MATVRDWLRNTAQKLLDKTTIDENIGRAFNSGRANLQAMGQNLAGAGQNIGNAYQRWQAKPSNTFFRNPQQGLQNIGNVANRIMGGSIAEFGNIASQGVKNKLAKNVVEAGTRIPGAISRGLSFNTINPLQNLQATTPGGKVGEFVGSMYGYGQSPITKGIVGVTNPIANKLVGKLSPGLAKIVGNAAPRLSGAIANVGQGLVFDAANRQPTTPLSVGLDVAIGLIGGPNQFKPAAKGFTMNKQTIDELIEAEAMIKQPEMFIGKIKTGARTEKEALKAIQARGLEAVERLSAKYLPNKELSKTRNVQQQIKALTDLHYQNRLTNMPEMGIVDKKNAQSTLGDIATKAKNKIGTTQNPREAGYILDNGEMLDFSGRHYAAGYKNSKPLPGKPDYLANQRNVDHREIADIFDENGGIDGSEAMLKFMDEGRAVRMSVTGGGSDVNFDVIKVPTPKQLQQMEKVAKNAERIYADITRPDGTVIKSGSFRNFKEYREFLNNYFSKGGHSVPEEAFGAVFGFEFEKDEDGNYRVKFNPQNAAIGIAAMAGVRQTKRLIKPNLSQPPKPQSTVGNINKKYYIYKWDKMGGKHDFVEVKGKPVKIGNTNIDAFIHRNTFDTGWSVSEAKSGLALSDSGSKTQKQAIEEATNRVNQYINSGNKIEDLIETAVQRNGLSPRFSNVSQAPLNDIKPTIKIKPSEKVRIGKTDTSMIEDAINQGDLDAARAIYDVTDGKKPPFISEQKTKRNRVVGDTNDEKLQRPMTEKGFVDHGQVEIPGAGVAKPKYTKNVIDEQTRQENLTNAVLAEDDPKLFRDIFTRWVGKRNAAKTTGAVEGAKYTDIPRNKGMEFIFHAEGTTKSEDPQIIAKAKQWKADTDRIYADIKAVAKEVGIKDLGYIDRYVTHYWKETPQQVNQILTQASKSNPSLRSRGIMTYEDGIKLGLTPKYDNPAQIMSEYVRKLEQTKANLDLFKELKSNGLVLTAAEARGVAGFEPINALGFPKSTANVNGTIVEGAYYAPSSVARQINKIFSPDEGNKVLSVIGEGTRKFQDITLSGGLPGTPLNAFTVAQVQKELLAGRIASPLKAVATSLNPQKSTKFFVDNAEQIKKMQVRDIDLSTNLNTKDLVGTIKDGTWDKLMSDPTFKRFMPILQINLFNDIEAQALKGGRGAEEAADIAAQAVKNFYGASSAAKDITTSQNTKNVTSTLFFAPKFRESMINFWKNNIKALKNPLALENRNNVKFIAGAAITYGVMNYLNNVFSGHDMAQNPDNKKDKLLIPLKDGYTLGIPFLSSIATVPRGVVRIAGDVVKGNYADAAKDAGQTFLSSTLKPTVDVMNNEDYFGKQIYDPDASTKDKQIAVAKYLGKQFLGHPWIKALIDSKDQPAYQTTSKALELPFRFYKSESIANAPFWEEYDRVKKYGQKYNEISDKNEKVKYYQQHKADIDQYDFMKERVKAYYADNKNSSFLHENTVVGNNVVIADGRIVEMDKFESIKTPPKFTGNKLLDKQLYSTYSGAITSRINDVEALYKAGIVDADQAEKMIGQLETLRKAAKTGSGNSTKAVITAKQLLSAYKKLLDSLGKLKSSRSSRSLKSYMSKTKYPKLKKMPKVRSMV